MELCEACQLADGVHVSLWRLKINGSDCSLDMMGQLCQHRRVVDQRIRPTCNTCMQVDEVPAIVHVRASMHQSIAMSN